MMSVCLLASIGAFAQTKGEKGTPTVVKEAFAKLFPGAKAKWEIEDKHYEAEFTKNKKEHSAVFDATGNLLETEVEVSANEVPKAALAYAKSHHSGEKIKEMAQITNDKGLIYYELEIEGKDLMFDKDGNFTQDKKETEGKDDKD